MQFHGEVKQETAFQNFTASDKNVTEIIEKCYYVISFEAQMGLKLISKMVPFLSFPVTHFRANFFS